MPHFLHPNGLHTGLSLFHASRLNRYPSRLICTFGTGPILRLSVQQAHWSLHSTQISAQENYTPNILCIHYGIYWTFGNEFSETKWRMLPIRWSTFANWSIKKSDWTMFFGNFKCLPYFFKQMPSQIFWHHIFPGKYAFHCVGRLSVPPWCAANPIWRLYQLGSECKYNRPLGKTHTSFGNTQRYIEKFNYLHIGMYWQHIKYTCIAYHVR